MIPSPHHAPPDAGGSPSGAGAGDAPAEFVWHHHRDFILHCVSRFGVQIAAQVQTVAIGWVIYERTGDKLALGLVGLAAFLPAIALMLVTGYVSDRFDRRLVLACCCATMTLACSSACWP